MNSDRAGAGAGAEGWAAAVNGSGDVVFVEASLHDDGVVEVDGAGSGLGIEIEVGVGGGPKMDAARSGFHPPLRRRIAADINGAGTCTRAKSPGDAVDVDRSGAGLRLDVTRGGDGEFELTGACLKIGRPVDVRGAD